MLNLGSIVYLDRGKADNLQKGEVFYILPSPLKRKDIIKRPYTYEQAVIGKLAIIHTTHHKATGIIIQVRDYVRIEDIFTSNLEITEDLSQSSAHETFEEQDAYYEEELSPDGEEISPEEQGDTAFDLIPPEGYEEVDDDNGIEFFDPEESERPTKVQQDEMLEIEFENTDIDSNQDPSLNMEAGHVSPPSEPQEMEPEDRSQEAGEAPQSDPDSLSPDAVSPS